MINEKNEKLKTKAISHRESKERKKERKRGFHHNLKIIHVGEQINKLWDCVYYYYYYFL